MTQTLVSHGLVSLRFQPLTLEMKNIIPTFKNCVIFKWFSQTLDMTTEFDC